MFIYFLFFLVFNVFLFFFKGGKVKRVEKKGGGILVRAIAWCVFLADRFTRVHTTQNEYHPQTPPFSCFYVATSSAGRRRNLRHSSASCRRIVCSQNQQLILYSRKILTNHQKYLLTKCIEI